MIEFSKNTKNSHLALPPSSADDTFYGELEAVNRELQNSLQGLYAPLLRVVQTQLQKNRPAHRAAFVLAAALPVQDSPEIQTSRIFLASALEMLHVALRVHHLLWTSKQTEADHTIEKSILGSIILAGDYCFSRAASLAARTNRPRVVEIFSQALQTVSEEQLRHLFHKSNQTLDKNTADESATDENTTLFQAGVLASTALTTHSKELESAYSNYANTLHEQLALKKLSLPSFIPLLAPQQATRWNAYITWIDKSL